jgi:hypothetical protein
MDKPEEKVSRDSADKRLILKSIGLSAIGYSRSAVRLIPRPQKSQLAEMHNRVYDPRYALSSG